VFRSINRRPVHRQATWTSNQDATFLRNPAPTLPPWICSCPDHLASTLYWLRWIVRLTVRADLDQRSPPTLRRNGSTPDHRGLSVLMEVARRSSPSRTFARRAVHKPVWRGLDLQRRLGRAEADLAAVEFVGPSIDQLFPFAWTATTGGVGVERGLLDHREKREATLDAQWRRGIGNAPWCDVSIIWARRWSPIIRCKAPSFENKTHLAQRRRKSDRLRGRSSKTGTSRMRRRSARSNRLKGGNLVPRHGQGARMTRELRFLMATDARGRVEATLAYHRSGSIGANRLRSSCCRSPCPNELPTHGFAWPVSAKHSSCRR